MGCWPVMNDSYMKDLNLFTCLDDASMSVAGYTLFEEVASENVVAALLCHATTVGCAGYRYCEDYLCLVSEEIAKSLQAYGLTIRASC